MTERTAGATLLTMEGVHKRFGSVQALAGVDLAIRAGEVHALLGENGAGKSTLMKVLSGAISADDGRMTLGSAAYAPSGPLDALEAGVAMIYQELNLAPDLSVVQNIVLGREPRRFGCVDRGVAHERARQALARLGRADLSNVRRVAELGPGARQLVEIARALVGEPRVVVLDEPTSSLSKRDTEELFEVVARLAASGVAVVYISHFLEEVQHVATRFTVLRDGASVGSGVVEDTSSDELIAMMVGRKLEEFFPRVAREPGEVVLRVRGLAGERLPTRASFELRRGEILGLAGLVGAGRTELLRTLFGLDPARDGVVEVAGVARAIRSPRAGLALGFGLVPEDRKREGVSLGLDVATNVTLSRLAPFVRLGWILRAEQESATRHWCERLSIRTSGPRQPVGELSGGNQQKVALARLVHQGADVFLLDEPTRGIDVAAKVEVYRLMGELAAEGKAIVVVSSYLPELLGVCDRIAVMHRGVLGAARPAGEWSEHALLEEATRGSA